MASSGGASAGGGASTSSDITDFGDAVQAVINTSVPPLIATHAALRTDVHGAAAGTSKVNVIHSTGGTAGNMYVAPEASPPTAEFVDDPWIKKTS